MLTGIGQIEDAVMSANERLTIMQSVTARHTQTGAARTQLGSKMRRPMLRIVLTKLMPTLQMGAKGESEEGKE